MKFADALRIINGNRGYMVSFEHIDGCLLRSDHFPDKGAGEKLIVTEELAWDYARRFAEQAPENIVNIYVTNGDFTPVLGYEQKMLRKHGRGG